MRRLGVICRSFTSGNPKDYFLDPVFKIPTWRDPGRTLEQQDKLLFTPGPLTTSYPTKKAGCRDLGSRDIAFINVINAVREKILKVANVSSSEWTSVLMQGSGTFGVEAVLSSVVPHNNSLLIIANGAYGRRMGQSAKLQRIDYKMLDYQENEHPDLEAIDKALAQDTARKITHVAVVESETTSGIINDVTAIGQIVKKHNRSFIVDAMSSFGSYQTDLKKANIDYIVTSANKCLEGIPGFSIIIANKTALKSTQGNARSLSLDIHAQTEGLDKTSQFRFTPPTHSILAFNQALLELDQEGGPAGRQKRYQANQKIILEGLTKLGFDTYFSTPEQKKHQGWIISSFRYPLDKSWDFNKFYQKLNDMGFVIYPGKVSTSDCFRIGHIGRIFPSDSKALVEAIDRVCSQMKTVKYSK